jgi:hypothetical protein
MADVGALLFLSVGVFAGALVSGLWAVLPILLCAGLALAA